MTDLYASWFVLRSSLDIEITKGCHKIVTTRDVF